MKIIRFLISFYIAALSVLPCNDIMAHNDHEKMDSEVIEQTHTEDTSHEDVCTPFCTCSCCGAVLSLPSKIEYVLTKPIALSNYIFPYQLNYTFNFIKGVWHPPAYS